jgi:hypothetical protein
LKKVAVKGAHPDHCAALKFAEGGTGADRTKLLAMLKMHSKMVMMFFIGFNGFVVSNTILM